VGVAVSVTIVPEPNGAEQVVPQLMPAGADVTDPVPGPASVIDSVICLSVNVAATAVMSETLTTHIPTPEQPAPDQPPKSEFAAGVAVSVTIVPAAKLAEQVPPQLIPAGPELTVPDPLPAGTTVRR
jgi:hypothetical protein